jgi:hypothetical protein
MSALCNDPARCEVMNLAWGANGHGPYLVRQEGYEPGSSTFKMQRFILQKDGHWLLNLAFVMLTEAEQEAQLFHSLTEVLQIFESLRPPPCRCQCGRDPRPLRAMHAPHPARHAELRHHTAHWAVRAAIPVLFLQRGLLLCGAPLSSKP